MHYIIMTIDNSAEQLKKVLYSNPSEKITIENTTLNEYIISCEEKDFLHLKLAEMITEYIMKYLELPILKNILSSDYSYFEPKEKKYILKKSTELISDNNSDFLKMIIILKRRFLIKQDILECLNENTHINLSGFVNFRLKEYKKMLSELLEKVVKDYKLQKEYKEFITMLKFFVDTQKNRCSKLHIIFEPAGSYTILDEYNVDITKKCFDEFLEAKGSSLNNEDLLLSSLITLAPRKVFLHFEGNNYNKKIVNTIEQIFEKKVFLNSIPALEIVR